MKSLVIYLLTIFLLAACQKEVIVKEASVPDGAAPSIIGVVPSGLDDDTTDGGFDGVGGGNGVDGAPFESFIQSMHLENEVAKNIVLPIITKISKYHPQLAAELHFVLAEKTWYLIPVSLNKIPNHRIGSHVGDKETDQLAVQDSEEVWMDARLLNRMSEEEQAAIIIHELVMGVRLLEFANRKNLCVASSYELLYSSSEEDTLSIDNRGASVATKDVPRQTETKEDLFRESKNQCFKDYGNTGGDIEDYLRKKTIRLSDDDYRSIRKLTSILLDSDQRDSSHDEIEFLFKAELKRQSD